MRRCEERSKRGLQVFKDMWGKVLWGGRVGGSQSDKRGMLTCGSVCVFTDLNFSCFYQGDSNFCKWRQSCKWSSLVFMCPAGHTFALKMSHLNKVFEEFGGSCCISASIRLPLSFLLTPLLLCGHCVGLCSVIAMTDQRCQPKRSLCLFVLLQKGLNCQVDNSQDP